MCRQYYDREYCCHDEEGKPGLDKGPAADIFPVYQHQDGECDHVPPGAVLVAHDVQGPGHVRVTVVTAEVVHPALVDLRGLRHSSVIGCRAPAELGVQRPVLGRGPEGHAVLADVVRPGEVPDDALRGGDPHVADKGEQPGEAGDGGPHNAGRVTLPLMINLGHAQSCKIQIDRCKNHWIEARMGWVCTLLYFNVTVKKFAVLFTIHHMFIAMF